MKLIKVKNIKFIGDHQNPKNNKYEEIPNQFTLINPEEISSIQYYESFEMKQPTYTIMFKGRDPQDIVMTLELPQGILDLIV